jgi:hypothetical protein
MVSYILRFISITLSSLDGLSCLFPLMGRFSARTASPVLLYKESPTCPVDGK